MAKTWMKKMISILAIKEMQIKVALTLSQPYQEDKQQYTLARTPGERSPHDLLEMEISVDRPKKQQIKLPSYPTALLPKSACSREACRPDYCRTVHKSQVMESA